MILELYVATREQRHLAVSQLCSLSGGSTTTALRHIAHLEGLGHISRGSEPDDRRRARPSRKLFAVGGFRSACSDARPLVMIARHHRSFLTSTTKLVSGWGDGPRKHESQPGPTPRPSAYLSGMRILRAFADRREDAFVLSRTFLRVRHGEP